ncbi:MAG TPA: class I SAM-dependent methyltransferase [Bradyrhizobium sp.]|nr:class I SAM-dependent methyltransferase [Bradyrhizobium sp.]
MTSEPLSRAFPRFQSTVPHYLAGRPNYAPSLIRIVREHLHLTGSHRLLDLGCGPGWLGIAFAPFVGSVLAIDPEPAMLEAARAVAVEANVRIELMEGSSYDLDRRLGVFDVVTIGRAFHWMDRADTLRRLDAMVEPGGAVILFNDIRPDVPENRWNKHYNELVESYVDPKASIPLERIRHEAVLLDSCFNALVRIGVIERRQIPIERLVDRALSMSTSSPEQLGQLSERLARDLRTKMLQFAADGSVVDVIEWQALIAQRSDSNIASTL